MPRREIIGHRCPHLLCSCGVPVGGPLPGGGPRVQHPSARGRGVGVVGNASHVETKDNATQLLSCAAVAAAAMGKPVTAPKRNREKYTNSKTEQILKSEAAAGAHTIWLLNPPVQQLLLLLWVPWLVVGSSKSSARHGVSDVVS